MSIKIAAIRARPKTQAQVPAAIARLHCDHLNMMRLLEVLQHQAATVIAGRRVDWNIVRGLAAYYRGYVAKFHHPMEDLLFGLLRIRAPIEAMDVFAILEDHRDSGHWLQHLEHAATTMEGAEKSRSKRGDTWLSVQEGFASAVWNFINRERQHMIREERLYRLAVAKLLKPDWAHLDKSAVDTIDPVFDGAAKGRFIHLRAAILAADTPADN
jgi:hemerythrin-like domain-containing protein